MTIAEERKAFIRPDGKEKVTGAGRYTADLNLTGQLYAKFRYADHPHARIKRIDTTAASALPGVFAVITHEDVPDVLYGGMVQDRRLFAKEKVRWEGDVVAAVAARTPQIAAQAATLIVVEYEVLEPLPDFLANMGECTFLVHEGWSRLRGRRKPRPQPQHAWPLDHRQRRRHRRHGHCRRGGPQSLRIRRLPGCSDRASGDPGPMAGRQGDCLVINPGPFRGPHRHRLHPPNPRVAGPGHRPPPRWWIRVEMRLSFRSTRRRSGPRHSPRR